MNMWEGGSNVTGWLSTVKSLFWMSPGSWPHPCSKSNQLKGHRTLFKSHFFPPLYCKHKPAWVCCGGICQCMLCCAVIECVCYSSVGFQTLCWSWLFWWFLLPLPFDGEGCEEDEWTYGLGKCLLGSCSVNYSFHVTVIGVSFHSQINESSSSVRKWLPVLP